MHQKRKEITGGGCRNYVESVRHGLRFTSLILGRKLRKRRRRRRSDRIKAKRLLSTPSSHYERGRRRGRFQLQSISLSSFPSKKKRAISLTAYTYARTNCPQLVFAQKYRVTSRKGKTLIFFSLLSLMRNFVSHSLLLHSWSKHSVLTDLLSFSVSPASIYSERSGKASEARKISPMGGRRERESAEECGGGGAVK